jgi:hypothetical protein
MGLKLAPAKFARYWMDVRGRKREMRQKNAAGKRGDANHRRGFKKLRE